MSMVLKSCECLGCRSETAGTSERLEAAQRQAEGLHSQVADLQQQLEKHKAAAAKQDAASRQHLQRLALEAARRERESSLLRVQDDGVRLGSLSVMRAGPIGGPLYWSILRRFLYAPCGIIIWVICTISDEV